MNVNVNPSSGMALLSIIQILTIIIGIAKEVLMIFLLFKGIQVANVYLMKNKDWKAKNTRGEEDLDEDNEDLDK
ncbi:hypothetical protein CULT_110050 [[Clostridium] ultunense Esp]|uniref:Uncharacterized protein n=1 Tax=[Clostridium] ultunense Esp TaxID=1288971 RepID=M1ZGC8_9FIRM|nr:hypothetical protein [Schnuerera ultunensis]CCQ92812.1 hypothetical protein CULT_110050 [[Clostridium] ultunense Esp]SHD75825.1 conserved protein of unknown function [[Clostridium] ultunense Esp]